MKIQVLIIEDDALTAQNLSEIISEQGMDVVDTAMSIKEARKAIETTIPDILLVDINLREGGDGIDFVKEIKSEMNIPVIYLTANQDQKTIDRALETTPASYLTKPYDDKDVLIAIELAFSNHCKHALDNISQARTSIFLRSGSKFEKVQIDTIQYLQADGSYCKFVTKDKEYFLSGNLLNVSNQLKNPSFLRIHRSYVVNVNNITGLDHDYVFIDEKNIPIGRSHREEVNKIFKKIS